IQELNKRVIDINSTSSALLFANVGSSTLINNTIQNSFNTLSLFLASTTDLEIASTTLANLNDLFSTSSLASIKALTNTLTRSNFDLNLNGNALVNVKSIEGSSKNWRIGDDGICLKKSTTGSICIDGNKLEELLNSQNTANNTSNNTSSNTSDGNSTSTASSTTATSTSTSTSTNETNTSSSAPVVSSTNSDPAPEPDPAPTTSSIPVVTPPSETAPAPDPAPEATPAPATE
ncbi:MAG: Peptidase protein, partial [Patescibacteria group bacterium]|nr:Peptidase protein [Patescibacteria group bacterium]